MFGIGFGEILIVLIVIIIFVRPDDLPKFLYSAGRFYGKVKKMYKEIMEVKDSIIDEVDKALPELTDSEEIENIKKE